MAEHLRLATMRLSMRFFMPLEHLEEMPIEELMDLIDEVSKD